jgi:hypothetical protein
MFQLKNVCLALFNCVVDLAVLGIGVQRSTWLRECFVSLSRASQKPESVWLGQGNQPATISEVGGIITDRTELQNSNVSMVHLRELVCSS